MAKLRIYNAIVDEEEKVFLQDWCGVDGICYKDIPEFLDSMEEGDNQIDIRLHCPGGNCIEGWAIYDALRNSGKEISATIEGECSSMATIILLAAPKERRYAFENARMCIHNPHVEWLDLCTAERLTADEIDRLKGKLDAQETLLREEQNRILDLYVERTGASRDELQQLMDEDKFVDMAKAAELGFISGTLAPNTAKKNHSPKNKKMAKEKITIENRVVKQLLKMAGIAKVEDVKILDQKITAADGTEFTVEREDGDPQVGDKAYPNGTYVLDDGTTIVVEDEVITSITTEDDTNEPVTDPEPAQQNLAEQVTALTAQVNELTEQVSSLKNENEALKGDNETLTAEAKTEEEKEILDIVSKAGGKKWLDSLKGVRSTFNANNRSFVEHGSKTAVQQETTTQRLIREQREKQEARRAASKK
jgi:ATP-dependent Clp protease protease subunit